MKRILYSCLLIFTPFLIFAQAAEKVLVQADQMPYFIGCEDHQQGSIEKRKCSNQSLVNFLSANVEYPESAKKDGLEGTVYVSFIIDKSGVVTEPSILRDIGGGCGEKALEAVKKMPAWEAAIQDEKAVNVKLNIPIQFNLKDQEPDASDEYRITWGNLKRNKVSRKQLKENLSQMIFVRDKFGNAQALDELTFNYARKKRNSSTKSKGNVSKKMKKLVKKVKKGGFLTITAVIQKNGNFVQTGRTFEIID